MRVKIYTKTGDGGQTGLFGGPRVAKDDDRVEAYGSIDELSAALGLARSRMEFSGLRERMSDVDLLVGRAQERLFAVGADLATPPEAKARAQLPPVEPAWVEELENAIDLWERDLAPLRSFVVPGGAALAATLHLARAVCRRAERRVVALHRREPVAPVVLAYLNRLADFLFVAARVANQREGIAEEPWEPARRG